jgi:hypothetical protein
MPTLSDLYLAVLCRELDRNIVNCVLYSSLHVVLFLSADRRCTATRGWEGCEGEASVAPFNGLFSAVIR